jgi:tetratricopeptide (TPR) repeat protein
MHFAPRPYFILRSQLMHAAVVGISVLLLAGCSAEAKKARIMERGGKHFSAGEYEKAKIEYLNVLQIAPEDARAHERIGIISLEQGAPLRAVPSLAKVRTLEPNNLIVREKLIRALLALGKISDARREAVAVLEKAPDRGEALFTLSETVRNKSELDQATQAMEAFRDRSSPYYLMAQASQDFLKGDATAALEKLQRAKRIHPDSAPVRTALASSFMRQGDQKSALAEFQKAAELSPVRSPERVRAIEYLAQTGAAKEAVAQLNELIRQAPDFLTPKYAMARMHFADKNYDAAEALTKDILARESTHVETHLLRAYLLQAKNEQAKAIEELTALKKSIPGLGAVYHHLARMHIAVKQVDAAKTVLAEGISTDIDYVDNMLLLAELNIRTGKANDAIPNLVSLVQQRPLLVQAQMLLTSALRAAGRLDDAVRLVREQVRVYPGNPQPYVVLGRLLFEQKKPDEARATLEKALEVAPNFTMATSELIDLDLREKKFEAALARARAHKTKNPAAAEGDFFEGKVFAAQQKWNEAEAPLQRALEINPNLSPAYNLLISALFATGRAPQATQQLEQLLAKNPNDQRALLLSGMIYGSTNDHVKAKERYEKLLAINPDVSIALNNLAMIQADKLGQLDPALELANKARSLEPESPLVADTLGWILYRRGDYDGALALIKEAAAKLPEEPEVQYHLGLASRMKGDNATAAAALRAAANTTRNFPDKEAAKQELARLERGEPAVPLSASTR